MRVGIVGAGLQCRRRLSALAPGDDLVAIAAPDLAAAEREAAPYGARAVTDWADLVALPDIEAVVVATPPDSHEEISTAALAAGKHVLCEKPLARDSASAARMEAAARRYGRVLHCGFNHRFHPAVLELGEIVRGGRYGDVLSALAVYGYGYRDGYEKEWRADPAVVSGGQLMEQGVHLLDLVDHLLWPITGVIAHTQQSFGLPAGIEDDANLMLRSDRGQVALVRSSLSQWRNRFLFEATLEGATVRIDGLGGSYGDQTLTVEERADGPFSSRVTVFRGADRSWAGEWAYFQALAARTPAAPPDAAGRRALAVAEAAYRSAETGSWTAVTWEDDV